MSNPLRLLASFRGIVDSTPPVSLHHQYGNESDLSKQLAAEYQIPHGISNLFFFRIITTLRWESIRLHETEIVTCVPVIITFQLLWFNLALRSLAHVTYVRPSFGKKSPVPEVEQWIIVTFLMILCGDRGGQSDKFSLTWSRNTWLDFAFHHFHDEYRSCLNKNYSLLKTHPLSWSLCAWWQICFPQRCSTWRIICRIARQQRNAKSRSPCWESSFPLNVRSCTSPRSYWCHEKKLTTRQSIISRRQEASNSLFAVTRI